MLWRHNGVVFLFDVDNTLLGNDTTTDDLKRHIEQVWCIQDDKSG